MSGVQGFVNKRQQVQPDPRRQALVNQYKVPVPATRLGSAEPRPSTTQPSHSGLPYAKKDVRQPDSRFAQTSNGHGDVFDTDAEGIDDTTVTSIGNSSSNHQSSTQDGFVSNGQNTGGSNGFPSGPGVPFADEYNQHRSRQKLDQLDGEDLTMEDDGESYEEESGDEEVEAEGEENGEGSEEDGSTDGENVQEYQDQIVPEYQNQVLGEYLHGNIHQIMASPTMQDLAAQKMGIRSNRPDQPISQSFPKHSPAGLFQANQQRSIKQRVTSDRPASLNPRAFQLVQQSGQQGLNTPPPTSSKSVAAQRRLVEKRLENQPLPAIESRPPSLAANAQNLQVRMNQDTRKTNAGLSTTTQHGMMPPPGYRKASPAPNSNRNREAKRLQQDGSEKESGFLNDQPVGLGHDDSFTHEDLGADDIGSPASYEGTATRKHARDLDYSPDQFSVMTFEQLSGEPFNHDPKRTGSVLPEEVASSTLAEKLDHMLKLGEHDTKEFQRKAILSSLAIEQYKECGDLIVGRFVKVITKFSDARQQRRAVLMRFEAEVAKRECRVTSKTGAVEKDLARLKRGGEVVVKGEADL